MRSFCTFNAREDERADAFQIVLNFCAELVAEEHHGMAFGVLAMVNGVGDFLSSVMVGVLWTSFGTTAAFGYSFLLFGAGGLMVMRTGMTGRREAIAP